MPLEPGLTASFDHVVTADDTAIAHGSGDVPVLATPKVVALVESATVRSVAHQLPPDLTTVGIHVVVNHILPTAIGTTVRVQATLETVDGGRLSFAVRVRHDERTLAQGTVVRQVVTRERFLAGLRGT